MTTNKSLIGLMLAAAAIGGVGYAPMQKSRRNRSSGGGASKEMKAWTRSQHLRKVIERGGLTGKQFRKAEKKARLLERLAGGK